MMLEVMRMATKLQMGMNWKTNIRRKSIRTRWMTLMCILNIRDFWIRCMKIKIAQNKWVPNVPWSHRK